MNNFPETLPKPAVAVTPPRHWLSSFLLLPAILLVLLLVSCPNPAGSEGSVIISLPGAAGGAARNVKPGGGLTARMAYTVTCTGPGGVLTQTLAPGTAEAVFRLGVGSWTVTVMGTVDGVPIAYGSAVVDVTGRSGQRAAVNLDFYAEADFDTDGSPLTDETVDDIFTVTAPGEWTAALSAISEGGNDRNYLINVTGDVTVPGGLIPSFGTTATGIKVTISGGGGLTLSSAGRLLYINAAQTVVLRDITLTGIDGNSAALVLVSADAALTMYDGAVVTGNKNTTGLGGGGVQVSGGTFTMRGGTIRDNEATDTSYGMGAGVHLAGSGTFIMHGGTIAGNHAAGSGGGVYFSGTGTFTMQGGTIGGTAFADANTAAGGGGVFVSSGTTFTMSGGAVIAGNKAEGGTTGHGGGVYVQNSGTFTMQGGTVSVNTALGDGVNPGDGGGVYASGTSSAFTMSGGTIGDNSAGSQGGGVYFNGTFTTGGSGEISGNVAPASNGKSVWNASGSQITVGGVSINSNDGEDGDIIW